MAKKMLMAKDYKLKINRYFNNDFKAYIFNIHLNSPHMMLHSSSVSNIFSCRGKQFEKNLRI